MATPRITQEGVEGTYTRSDRDARITQEGVEGLFTRSDRDARITQEGVEVIYIDTGAVAEARVSQLVLEILYTITVPAEPEVAVVTEGCPQIQGAAAMFRPEGANTGALMQGAAAMMRLQAGCA